MINNEIVASLEEPGSAAPAHTAGEGHHPPADPVRARLARMIVVFSLALTVVATALIYWRWASVKEPSSYIVVEGNEGHNGAVVVVRSPSQPEAMATLSPENGYAATIFLQPGTYTLTATLNGETLVHGELLALHRRMRVLRLRGGKPAAAVLSEPKPVRVS